MTAGCRKVCRQRSPSCSGAYSRKLPTSQPCLRQIRPQRRQTQISGLGYCASAQHPALLDGISPVDGIAPSASDAPTEPQPNLWMALRRMPCSPLFWTAANPTTGVAPSGSATPRTGPQPNLWMAAIACLNRSQTCGWHCAARREIAERSEEAPAARAAQPSPRLGN